MSARPRRLPVNDEQRYGPTVLLVDESGCIEDAGIEVGDAVILGVCDNRAVAALVPEDLKTHLKRLDLRGCDALVLSACVRMPSPSAIEAGRAA